MFFWLEWLYQWQCHSLPSSIRQACYCSVTKSCPTLCNSMDYSMSAFSVLNYLLDSIGLVQTQVHWVSDAIQPSHPLLPPSPPATRSFPVSQLFISCGQSVGASALLLPMSIQGWFPLGLTGLVSISLPVWINGKTCDSQHLRLQ